MRPRMEQEGLVLQKRKKKTTIVLKYIYITKLCSLVPAPKIRYTISSLNKNLGSIPEWGHHLFLSFCYAVKKISLSLLSLANLFRSFGNWYLAYMGLLHRTDFNSKLTYCTLKGMSLSNNPINPVTLKKPISLIYSDLIMFNMERDLIYFSHNYSLLVQ